MIENDELRRTRGALAYNYAPQPKYIEPFKRLIKSNSPWLAFIKDFNFNYTPSQISFKADVFRQFGATRTRNIGGGPYKIPETYNKYFTFDRYYILQWSLTRSMSLDFTATNNARIDEPFGRIDTKEKKDSVKTNLFKGGRNTQYTQQATLTYNVPTQKIPLLTGQPSGLLIRPSIIGWRLLCWPRTWKYFIQYTDKNNQWRIQV